MRLALGAAGAALCCLLVAGCGAAKGKDAHPVRYPSSAYGIPVREVPWGRTLPYVTKILYQTWTTRPPSTPRVSPEVAIRKAFALWPSLRLRATRIFVQLAHVAGGGLGNLRAAYLVEVAAPNLGLNGAPAPITPPKMEFAIFLVNAETGAAEQTVAGGWPPEALVPSWMPEQYDVKYGSLYNLTSVAFQDASREIVAGALATDPSTGVLVIFALMHDAPPAVVEVPGAGEITITGFVGDALVRVRSGTFGAGTFRIGSSSVIWERSSLQAQ